jgi:hypothetical protein
VVAFGIGIVIEFPLGASAARKLDANEGEHAMYAK